MAGQDCRSYATPFKRHLAFFDRNNDGYVYFGESLRGNLAIGFDFPVAFAMALGYQTIYGNTHPAFWGPFRGIEIAKVQEERNMLQGIDAASIPRSGLDRKMLIASSGVKGPLDKLHLFGFWALASNREGLLQARDIQKFQYGTILYELEQRRRDRSDVLPLHKGGPVSAAGHSWFVDKLFGVKVYQKSPQPYEKVK